MYTYENFIKIKTKISTTKFLSFSIFIALLFLGTNANAAYLYVRDGSSGSCTNNWSNACDSLSSAESAASNSDTIYIASGSYSATDINVANLTVKKATVADHGSDTGWNASYANQATFSGGMTISATGVTIDGAYRDDDNWDDHTAYGFYLTTGGKGIRIESNGPTIKYIAIDPGNTSDAFYVLGPDNGTIAYTYTFDVGRCNFLGRDISNWLFEYNYFGRSGLAWDSKGTHSEAFSVYSGSNDYNTIRYNYTMQFNSTGGLIFGDSDYTFVYGNIFKTTLDFANNGVIGSWTGYTSTNWRIYNNTFIDTPDKVNILLMGGSFSGSIVRNNLFYNNSSETIANSTQSHQATDGANVGTNCQTNITNQFASRANENYRLTAATYDGYHLTNETVNGRYHTYNTDMDGNVRAADGTWDRGAFEYGGSVSISSPSIPTGLRVVTQ